MPIYEYECQKCGEVFEVFQKHSDPPPKKHSCGSKRVRRIMSQTSFVLKGTGWYVTDYGRKGQKNDEGSSKKPKKESSSSSGSDSSSSSSSSSDSSSSSSSSSSSGSSSGSSSSSGSGGSDAQSAA